MKNTILLSITSVLALVCSLDVMAQGNIAPSDTVPQSVRDMILRSQAGTQYEQTARVQMDVQYGEFLQSLATQPNKRYQVEDVLVEILQERAELSDRVARSEATPDELKAISGYGYVRARIAPLLSAAEIAVIDAQRNGPTDEQLKDGYADELSRTTGSLTENDKDLVLETIVKHIRMSQDDGGNMNAQSVDDLIQKQSASFMHARMEMDTLFDAQKLEQVDQFMGRLHNNLYRNRNMSDAQ
ncbi:MAG: hypothetical protein WDZ52_10095 [Pseudohongiellaceae bacterium]